MKYILNMLFPGSDNNRSPVSWAITSTQENRNGNPSNADVPLPLVKPNLRKSTPNETNGTTAHIPNELGTQQQRSPIVQGQPMKRTYQRAFSVADWSTTVQSLGGRENREMSGRLISLI